jgi:hypothetical protein
MLLYRERLRVPISWWLAGGACVLILGTTLAAGLSVAVGIAIYLGMGALLALAFLTWGSVTVRVTGDALVAGPVRLALGQVGEVSAMDAAQTRALRGPNADVAAYLLVRPYLAESVYVAVAGRPADRPYLLIGTRRPAQLTAAIQAAMAGLTAGQQGACDDVEPGDHAADRGAIEHQQAAHQRKDSNAR